MDKQKVFETVSRHLFAQGKRSVTFNLEQYNKEVAERIRLHMDGLPDPEEYQSCRYLSPDGSKCAVGVLIPSEVYDPIMEGACVSSLLEAHPHLKELLDISSEYGAFGDMEFLYKLQSTHDSKENWKSTEDMRKRLRDVAFRFGLNDTFLNELSFSDR